MEFAPLQLPFIDGQGAIICKKRTRKTHLRHRSKPETGAEA
ncbi:hypothetical protein EPYR_01141 [Erwinia pyrifoliae DSM 12163]|nr:hypothetical protein EPYR_01141 [Erwinia pyrifoliae DSM 12163]